MGPWSIYDNTLKMLGCSWEAFSLLDLTTKCYRTRPAMIQCLAFLSKGPRRLRCLAHPRRRITVIQNARSIKPRSGHDWLMRLRAELTKLPAFPIDDPV